MFKAALWRDEISETFVPPTQKNRTNIQGPMIVLRVVRQVVTRITSSSSQGPKMSSLKSVVIVQGSGVDLQVKDQTTTRRRRRRSNPKITIQSPDGKIETWSSIPSSIDELTRLYLGNDTLKRYRHHRNEPLLAVTDRMYRQICASNEAAVRHRASMSEPSKLYHSFKSAATQALTTILSYISLWWSTYTPPVHDYLRGLPYINHLYAEVPLPTPEEQMIVHKARLYRDSLSRNDWHRRDNAAVRAQFRMAAEAHGRRPASDGAARHVDTHLRYIHRTDYLVAVLGLSRPGGEGCHRFRRDRWRRRFFGLDGVTEADAGECEARIDDFCKLKGYIAGLGIFARRPASARGVADVELRRFERECEEYLAACVVVSGCTMAQWPAVLRDVPHHVKGLYRREGASSRLSALL